VPALNLHQGLIRMAPARGSEREGLGMVPDGWGCRMWEQRARARLPPAESPAMMIFPSLRRGFWVRKEEEGLHH
jgi:hypothetical protein